VKKVNTLPSRPKIDFLEYMQSLEVWQDWKPRQPLPSQANSTRSPWEIPDYTKHHELLHHPWLKQFQQAQISPNLLHIWLKQRYLISWCFPNWLLSLVAKLPTAEARIPLLMNLQEEHGLSSGHTKPHPQMWQQLFEELEVVAPGESLPLPSSPADLIPGTHIYLQLYTEACFKCPTPVGLGAISFTESILPYENRLILEGLNQLGVSESGQEFFAVHCACDQAHADELIGVIEQVADEPETIQQVWQGVEMAVTARQTFYNSLLNLQQQQAFESILIA
jgi:pyrroloquinoline quinone (PQQ) biosynthesis protein C